MSVRQDKNYSTVYSCLNDVIQQSRQVTICPKYFKYLVYYFRFMVCLAASDGLKRHFKGSQRKAEN